MLPSRACLWYFIVYFNFCPEGSRESFGPASSRQHLSPGFLPLGMLRPLGCVTRAPGPSLWMEILIFVATTAIWARAWGGLAVGPEECLLLSLGVETDVGVPEGGKSPLLLQEQQDPWFPDSLPAGNLGVLFFLCLGTHLLSSRIRLPTGFSFCLEEWTFCWWHFFFKVCMKCPPVQVSHRCYLRVFFIWFVKETGVLTVPSVNLSRSQKRSHWPLRILACSCRLSESQ